MITDEMLDGHSLTMIANELGVQPSWVSDRLAELRQEIILTHSNNHLYPLGPGDLDSLRDSIKQYGIQSPVLIGDHTVIDGRHRCLVAKELGIEVPTVFVRGLSKEEEHEIALAVNSVRRQMSQKQKHELVRRELLANWSKSDRSLATICGVSAPTIGRIREELRREQETQPTKEQVAAVRETKERILAREPEVRVDRKGKEFVVEPKTTKEPAPALGIVGYGSCKECGVTHTIVYTGGGYDIRIDRD